jgi:seryl-tRNA synthetase
MTAHTIALDAPVPAELIDEVADKLAYASDLLRTARLADDGSRVEITVDHPDQVELVGADIRAMIQTLVRGYREVERPVLWRSAATPAYRAPIWDDLVRSGEVVSAGPGCVALIGDACRLVAALDRRFAAIAHDAFGAIDHQYPVVIARDVMERCDYFASFPHHITFALHLREGMDGITRVAEAPPVGRAAAIADGLSPPGHLLAPSVCFHTYACWADREIASSTVVTAVNRCFRWEASNFATCERLWDFTMREIVFAGDPAWVEARRADAVAETQRVVVELGLDGWLQAASDPFFIGRFAAKRYFQLVAQAKLELRLALPYSGSSLAAASFNLHQDFFGRAYAVRRAGADGFATTGCVGFGLERWAWALFAQHGPRIAGWPAEVRRALEL